MTDSSRPHPETDDSIRLARRPLLLGALGSAAAVALAGCTDRAESAQPDTAADQATHLQIIAHPDDDFYFFNLDLTRALQDGHRIITVCLSAGEADGKNLARKEDAWESTPTDYAGYAAARFTGARRTYAQMATGDVNAEWKREAYPVSNYLRAEKATLVANPNVVLLYFSLLENGKHSGHGGDRRLNHLWNGTAGDLPTLPLTGGTVSEIVTLSREDLIGSLVHLLDEFQPDVVRIMDTDPDPQLHDNDNPQFAEQDGYSDHIDHTGAAWFAAAALEQWLPENTHTKTRVIGYRGYYNQRWPRNLSPNARQEKGLYLDTYAWADQRDCGDPAGCGDSKLPADGVGKRYGSSTIHRHQGTDPSLVLDHDGQIHAAAVISGRLTVFTGDPTTMGMWQRNHYPRELPLMPYANAVVDQEGQLLVTGIEYHIGDNPSSHVRNIVVAEIDRKSPDEIRWHDLGNPAGSGSQAVRDVGVPQLVISSDGVRMVFCRNHGKGLSARMELEHGQWTGWIDLGGENTQDGLTAIVDHGDDSVRIFAAANDGIRMWRVVSQDEHSTELLTIDPPAGPVTAVSDRNGRIILLARQAGTSAIVMYQRPGSNEEWLRSPVILGGNGGIDQVSAMVMRPWETNVAILHRDDDARSSFAVVNYADLRPGTAVTQPDWVQSSPQSQRQPSMVLDRNGRVFTVATAMNGALYGAHQLQAGTGGLGNWTQLPVR